MLGNQFSDAPQAQYGFLVSQLAHVEQTMWEQRYPDITYEELVPITHEADEWAKTVTYYSTDSRGKADWIANRGRDINMVSQDINQHETTVEMAGIGYDYSLEEINTARKVGMDLNAMKANTARRVYEEMCERITFTGDVQKTFEGLLNTTSVTIVNADNGAGGQPTWASKTPDEILADVNKILSGVWSNTLGIEMCDTLLIPLEQFALIATKRLDPALETTVLDYILRKNVYTATTGKALTIRSLNQLKAAGGGGNDRAVAYMRDPQVVVMHIPMMLRFFDPQQIGLVWEIPGAFRLGGVDVRRPGAFRYLDDI